MLRKATGAALLLLPLTVLPAIAVDRKAFLIGFAVGGGTLDCFGCHSSGAGSVAVHLGGSISKKATLAAEFFQVIHAESFETRYSSQTTVFLQYWVLSRLWVGGGPGYGNSSIQFGNVTVSEPQAFAVALQVGVEVWQRGRFALVLRGRYGRIFTDPEATSHIVALAGFTWY